MLVEDENARKSETCPDYCSGKPAENLLPNKHHTEGPVENNPSQQVVTRFAPSPNGLLHQGHAYSALNAWRASRAPPPGGRFLLRIEDIDQTRARPEYEQAIYADLEWLGIEWEKPVRRQSEHFDFYKSILDQLEARGFLYPCFCTRKDIRDEIARSPAAPHGPEGPVYPGTCRRLDAAERSARIADDATYARRFDCAAALDSLPSRHLLWREWDALPQDGGVCTESRCDPLSMGDIILARKETPASYHLAVVADDHLQGINFVVRGKDLRHATPVQRLLQVVLGYPAPDYFHHRLILDDDGARMAKRAGSQSLASLREAGVDPAELRRLFSME